MRKHYATADFLKLFNCEVDCEQQWQLYWKYEINKFTKTSRLILKEGWLFKSK